jgi:putative membrane protein
MGVTAHEDTVKLFQKASADAKDPEVKAFATKTLPKLQHHLQMAQDLKKAVGGDDKGKSASAPGQQK